MKESLHETEKRSDEKGAVGYLNLRGQFRQDGGLRPRRGGGHGGEGRGDEGETGRTETA